MLTRSTTLLAFLYFSTVLLTLQGVETSLDVSLIDPGSRHIGIYDPITRLSYYRGAVMSPSCVEIPAELFMLLEDPVPRRIEDTSEAQRVRESNGSVSEAPVGNLACTSKLSITIETERASTAGLIEVLDIC